MLEKHSQLSTSNKSDPPPSVYDFVNKISTGATSKAEIPRIYNQLAAKLPINRLCFLVLGDSRIRIEKAISQGQEVELKLRNALVPTEPLIEQAISGKATQWIPIELLEFRKEDEECLNWLVEGDGDLLVVIPLPEDKVLFFTTRYVDHIKEHLLIPYQKLKETLRERDNRDLQLQTKITELNTAVKTLESIEKYIESFEKLSALGELTAGIAHEINSPLGVIKASAGNIRVAKEKIAQDFSRLIRSITDEKLTIITKLIEIGLASKAMSSREERALKKNHIKLLTENSIQDAEELAATLIDMSIYEDVTPLIKQLGDSAKDLVQFAYNVISLEKNNQNIACAVEQASKLIMSVKNYVHSDYKGDKSLNHVEEGINTVLTLYSHHLKSEVQVVKNFKEVPPIECYPEELNQVWINLIHNAIQAMNNKGTLELEITEEDEYVVVKITDTGVGIPKHLQARVFEAFFTTKPRGEGSGLGLDIAKKIVTKHGGTIGFESEPGKTIFTVKLPKKINVEAR